MKPKPERIAKIEAVIIALLMLSLTAVVAAGNRSIAEVERSRAAAEALTLRMMVIQNTLRYPRRPFVGPPEDVGGTREFEEMKRRRFMRYGPETLPPPKLRWEK